MALSLASILHAGEDLRTGCHWPTMRAQRADSFGTDVVPGDMGIIA